MKLTKEQREVLVCASWWIWHGTQPVGHGGPGRDPFQYWERRLTKAAVRMLNDACSTSRERVTRAMLQRMLDAIPPGDTGTPPDTKGTP
jgi:hypothetical protein